MRVLHNHVYYYNYTCYSVLEVVHSQPTHRDGNYSRLDLTGHLDLSPPKKPPPYHARRKG